MTGWNTPSIRHRLIAAGAGIVALAGTMGAGHAQDAVVSTPEPASASQTGPAFVPSAEASLEQAFAHLPEPNLDPAVPEHAVDIDTIEPAEPEATSLGQGVASYYGRRFAGRPTASGERFDPAMLTAAHRTLPFGSRVRVTNPRNGQTVVVRINDRGPFTKGRTIDLSRRAAEHIGIIQAGHGTVELELLVS